MPTGFTIQGIAPYDLRQHPADARLMFWSWVAELALKAKDRDLAAGLDARGEPLRPIAPATRRHRHSAMTPGGRGDPSAPPLMPARRLSRTRSLMAANAYPDRVEIYWRYDAFTGDTWSAILSIHAANGRDVFGMSPDALERVRLQALGKWLAWTRSGKVVPEEVRGKAAMPAMSLVGKARQPRYASPPGSTDLTHATQGIGTSASTEAAIRSGNWSGGMTEAQLRAFAVARAPAAVQSRPAAAYNRILSHVWGKPAGGASPIQPLMPKPVKPAPNPRPKPMTPLERARAALRDAERAQAEAAKSTHPSLPHRIDPTLPIGDRIKAYTLGDAKAQAVKDYARVVAGETEKDIDAIKAKLTVLNAKADEHRAWRKSILDESEKAWTAGDQVRANQLIGELAKAAEARKAIYDRIESLDDEAKKLRIEAARKIIEVLHLEPGRAVKFKASDAAAGARSKSGNLKPPSKSDKSTINKAMSWLSSLVHKGDGVWADEIDLRVGSGPRYRAHHRGGIAEAQAYHVQIKAGETESVVIHEYGHGIDARIMAGDVNVGTRSVEFLRHRIGDQKPANLKETFPNSTYDDDEIGADDDFARAYDGDRHLATYAGKIYPGRESSEILSMGLELLYKDPAAFAEKDPEWFKFVVGVMDGSLR